VLHLDANRAEIDVYNLGWAAYLAQRETDERRRKRERQNAERKADALMDQAQKMRAKATKAQAAQSMMKRAERLRSGLEAERRSDRVARIKFPAPAPCGKTPLTASELSKSYGSLEVFTDVDLAIDKGSRVVVLGLNGAGKTTLLRILAGVDKADTGEVLPGHGLKIGYYAQEHETLDTSRTVLENMHTAAPQLTDTEARSVLGSFLFSGDDAHVVGDLVADRGERPPHQRGLGVAHLGSVQGHDGDLAGHLVDESGRPQLLGSHARRLCAHASETRSAYDAVHRSSTPSGRISTRSGSRACTAPSSWVTSTMAPS
jgi:energy-coupling factor transporter ATP-binding protein EcfA2